MCPAVNSVSLPPTAVIMTSAPVIKRENNNEFIRKFSSIEHTNVAATPLGKKAHKKKPAVRFFCSLKKAILRCVKTVTHPKKRSEALAKETKLKKIKYIQGFSKTVEKKYSTTSPPEDEYNERLHDIKYRGMKIYSEMLVFARANAEFIAPKSIKGRYFKQSLTTLNNDIDSLHHEYESIEIKGILAKKRDARCQIDKYFKKLDVLNRN